MYGLMYRWEGFLAFWRGRCFRPVAICELINIISDTYWVFLIILIKRQDFWLFGIWSNSLISAFCKLTQQTQQMCITFIQRQPNVFDVCSTLYKCYTNYLCWLGSYPFQAWIYHCYLHPPQAANCCRNSRLVVDEDDLTGWKIKENCHVLVNQFRGNFCSKTLSCRQINCVFRDVKWCSHASWGLKG